MTYAAGAIVGLIFGGVIGKLKNLLIWKKYLQRDPSEAAGLGEMGNLYGRALISNAVNIAALAAAFFLRNVVPFDGIAFLVGTAVALSVMNRFLSIRQKKSENTGKEACGS